MAITDTGPRKELLTQLLWGVVFAVAAALVVFGKPLAGVPTLFGTDLGTAVILAADIAWVIMIVWKSVAPLPAASRDFWFLVLQMLALPLLQLFRSSDSQIISMGFRAVAFAAVAGSLSIIVRRFWGAK